MQRSVYFSAGRGVTEAPLRTIELSAKLLLSRNGWECTFGPVAVLYVLNMERECMRAQDLVTAQNG